MLRAIETAHTLGMTVIGFTGLKGRRFAALCDHALVAPHASTPRVQEGHIAMGHAVCQLVEHALFPRAGARADRGDRALIEGLRPRQWTKNLLLFAGVLFSRRLGEPALVLRAALGFAAFSLVASATYLLNDLRDLESDRQHPRKRLRPIASGRLSPAVARITAIVLVLIAAVLAWQLGPRFGAVLLAYLLLNLTYSAYLKRQVLLDVFAISSGFVLRAIGGVELLLPVAPGTGFPRGSWCAPSSARSSWHSPSAVASWRERVTTRRASGKCWIATRLSSSMVSCWSRRPPA